MQNESFYLGDWYDNAPVDEHDPIIKCVSVDNIKKEAIFEDGQRIPFMTLDLGDGRYEKIIPYTKCPEIMDQLPGQAASLGVQVAPSEVLGNLDKISKPKDVPQINESLREKTSTVQETETVQKAATQEIVNVASNDPVGTFIASAIQISRKAGKKSTIPLTLQLELDFDILYVIQSAIGLGASDIEILQHILRNINISESHIKKLIAEELLRSPEDAEIVAENREEQFTNILNEEVEQKLERYTESE